MKFVLLTLSVLLIGLKKVILFILILIKYILLLKI